MPKPKNYLIRSKQYFQYFLTELDRHERLKPYVPIRFSSLLNSFAPHSTASDMHLRLENLFDVKGYYKFGFTREPILRLKSYLRYKFANTQYLPIGILEQKFTNILLQILSQQIRQSI